MLVVNGLLLFGFFLGFAKCCLLVNYWHSLSKKRFYFSLISIFAFLIPCLFDNGSWFCLWLPDFFPWFLSVCARLRKKKLGWFSCLFLVFVNGSWLSACFWLLFMARGCLLVSGFCSWLVVVCFWLPDFFLCCCLSVRGLSVSGFLTFSFVVVCLFVGCLVFFWFLPFFFVFSLACLFSLLWFAFYSLFWL